jgi:hypothetical protein
LNAGNYVERTFGFIARLVSTDLSGYGVLDIATRQPALTVTQGMPLF